MNEQELLGVRQEAKVKEGLYSLFLLFLTKLVSLTLR